MVMPTFASAAPASLVARPLLDPRVTGAAPRGHARAGMVAAPQRAAAAAAVANRVVGPRGWRAQNALRLAHRGAPGHAGRGGARAAARGVVQVTAGKTKKVCVVNTAAGGHAVMGYYLAKELQEAGHKVTIMTACEEDSKKMQKEPFVRFQELRDLGVKTVWGDPANMAAATGDGKFDVVVDNNGKNLETVKPVVDWALAVGANQFIFVSSAGMYLPQVAVPVTEEDPVKESAGHAEVEAYVKGLEEIALSSFRPQYMVGEGNNKDCEEYFFDRIVRGRPILIPGSGDQVTNIAHARDNAHMIALAVGNEAAYNQIFNCVRDKGVTLDGLVAMCGEASGIKPIVIHYDAVACGIEAKKAFPFRTEYHFFTAPKNAMKLLGWEVKNDLKTDIVERFEAYKATDRMYAEKVFELDDKILKILNWKDPAVNGESA